MWIKSSFLHYDKAFQGPIVNRTCHSINIRQLEIKQMRWDTKNKVKKSQTWKKKRLFFNNRLRKCIYLTLLFPLHNISCYLLNIFFTSRKYAVHWYSFFFNEHVLFTKCIFYLIKIKLFTSYFIFYLINLFSYLTLAFFQIIYFI